MQKKGFSLIQVIIIVIISSLLSGLTVILILSKDKSILNDNSYNEVIKDENIKEFLTSYEELTNKYYKDIDKKELINHAISSMTDYLNESYTSLLDENELNGLLEQINGIYNGIGIITIDNMIVYVGDSSSAQKAGIKENDILTHINNIPVNGKSNSELLTIISKEKNIKIKVSRNGKTIDFNLEVQKEEIPSAFYKINNNKIGYIKINAFSKNLSTSVLAALTYFEDKKINNLIIDVRDNPGGYMKSAKEVASLFTKKDDIIYAVETEDGLFNYIDNDDIFKSFNIIILVNNYTASASEVLALALRDNNYATIVGVKTYGKGRVQRIYHLSNGNALKYTSALWYSPLKNSIDGIGISPDYIIENEKKYTSNKENILNITDSQLKFAEKLLLKK